MHFLPDIWTAMSTRNLFVVAILGMSAACSGVPTIHSGLQITTERSLYAFNGPYMYIPVVIDNPTAKTWALAECADVLTPLVEIERAGEWREHELSGCIDGGLKPRSIGPGERVTTHVFISEPGRFRVRATFFVDDQTRRFSRETSPAFEVQ